MKFWNYFKLGGAVVATAAVLSTMMFSAGASIIGDLNGDKEVNINDATYLQKVLVELEKAPENFETTADLYKDGKVDIRDATVIQMYIVNLIDSLPYNPNGEEPTTQPSSSQVTEPSSEATEPSSSQVTEPSSEATEPSSSEVTEPSSQEPSTEPSSSESVPSTDENGWGNQIFKP